MGYPEAETEMMMSRSWNGKAIVLRMLCAVALLFLGLAHRPAVEIARPDPAVLAYQLPDGTAPDLCVPQGSEKHIVSYPACDACRLAASVILPPAPADIAYVVPRDAPVYSSPETVVVVHRADRATLARGPPSFLDA